MLTMPSTPKITKKRKKNCSRCIADEGPAPRVAKSFFILVSFSPTEVVNESSVRLELAFCGFAAVLPVSYYS